MTNTTLDMDMLYDLACERKRTRPETQAWKMFEEFMQLLKKKIEKDEDTFKFTTYMDLDTYKYFDAILDDNRSHFKMTWHYENFNQVNVYVEW